MHNAGKRLAYTGPLYPWRCLCLGFLLQMTRTTPLRLMILQDSHIRRTDGLTFIRLPPYMRS